MADRQTIIEIKYDVDQAVDNLKKLSTEVETQKQQQKALKDNLKDGSITWDEYNEKVGTSQGIQKSANAERANTIKLISSEKGSIEKLKAQIKDITTKRDKLNLSTADGKKKAQEYNAQLENMKRALKGAQSETGKASGAFSKFGQNLNSLPGPIGGIVRGIGAMTKASLAFIATPIGAVIAALAIAILAVKTAFQASEEGQNKFAKIMTVIKALIGNLVDLFADLGEKIISAFEDPKKAIKDFVEMIKKNVTNRVVGLIELFPKLGEAIELVFKGQFKEAGKVATNAIMKVTTGIDNFTDKVKNAIDKTKELIEENKKEAREAAKVADMRAKADIMERELIIKRAKLESQIAELRLKGREEDQYTAEQRKKFLEEARDLQDNLLAEEKKVLELRRDAQILENTFSKTNKENKMKEAQAIADVSRKEAERFNQARQIQRELLRINNQLAAEQKKIEDEKKKAEEDELKRRGEAIAKLAELKQKEIENEAKIFKEKREIQKKAAEDEYNLLVENQKNIRELLAVEKDEQKIAELEAKLLFDEEMELAEYEHKLRLEEIEANYQANIKAMRDKALNEAYADMQEIIGVTRGYANQRVVILEDAFAKISTINWEEVQSSKDAFLQIGYAAQGLTALIVSGNEAQLADLEAKKQAELELAGENTQRKELIEKAYNKKLVAIKKAQAREEKRLAIVNAVIATALGITKALGAPFPLNFVLAALVGVLGGVQVATIERQKEPEFSSDKIFARGGRIVEGPDHASGGVNVYGDNGQYFGNVQGNEAMFVLKKDASAEIAALSMINEHFGGRSLTRPAKTGHFQEGGEMSSIDLNRAVDDALDKKPIFVKVGDIETGLTNYKNTKQAGTI